MSSVTQTDDTAGKTGQILWALGLLLLVGGWLSVLHVYRWHFTAPVFFLCAGWGALLLSARFLVRTAVAAAEDTGDADEESFWKPVGRREELLIEKRSLLKAIKEIEFDHEMGKMSEADAAELTRFYRHRAIEIIKALEAENDGAGGVSVREQIEREVKARLAVSGPGAKATKKKKGGKKKNEASAEARGNARNEAKAEAEAEAKAEAKPEVKAEAKPEASTDGGLAAATSEQAEPAARAEDAS
jgi:colicin import membrane protein